MATRQSQTDQETRKGVIMVIALVLGAIVLGGVMTLLWQSQEKSKKGVEQTSRYLSLGEQTAAVGENSMLVKFSVEYVDPETEIALKKALPVMKNQVVKKMSQLTPAELQQLRTRKGKEEFADDVLERIRGALPEETAGKVQALLYEKFLIGE